MCSATIACRASHGYGFTRGASETGPAGTGTVRETPTLGFTVPVTAVSRVYAVFHGPCLVTTTTNKDVLPATLWATGNANSPLWALGDPPTPSTSPAPKSRCHSSLGSGRHG